MQYGYIDYKAISTFSVAPCFSVNVFIIRVIKKITPYKNCTWGYKKSVYVQLP